MIRRVCSFEPLQDFTLPNHRSMARLMGHAQHQCFAELACIFDAEGQLVLQSSLVASLLSQGWHLTHLNRPIQNATDSLPLLWRDPRSIGVFQVHATVGTLLQTHLQDHQTLMDRHGLACIPVTWQRYCDHEDEAARDRKRRLRSRNLLGGWCGSQGLS